ncbi:hypothetical protein LGQ02_19555 [Bacillus shivajii]|nr:hypothetical protein LGQ02_19555 [Bacillus shivajii]
MSSAEIYKVVENTYRDINFAFANELAQICCTDNMNVMRLLELLIRIHELICYNQGQVLEVVAFLLIPASYLEIIHT